MAILESQSIAESQQYVEANGKRLEQSVRDNIVIPELTRKESFLLSSKIVLLIIFLGVLSVALIIAGFTLIGSTGNFGIVALIIIGFLLLGVTVGSFMYRAVTLASFQKKVSFDSKKAYVDFFQQNFENLSVVDFAKAQDIAPILRFRPSAVPADASVVSRNLGMQGKMDNFNYSSVWLRWMWTRTVTVGKTTTTQTYYYHALAGIFTGLNERFDNFSLGLSYPAVSIGRGFRKRAELEGAEFEKKTSIQSNDDIALRRFLTPRTQELILRDITEKNVAYTQMHVYNKSLIVFQKDTQECFNVNFKISRNRKEMIDSFAKDLKGDIAHAISFFSHIHNLETLHRG